MRRTKIVATLGPASESAEVIEQMAQAGMDIARFNLAHGSYEWHSKIFRRVREVAPNVATMWDIKGPEIRIGELPETMVLKQGDKVMVSTKKKGGKGVLFINYPDFPSIVEKGHSIFMCDGTVELVVKAVKESEVECIVEEGGKLTGKNNVTVPGANAKLPVLSKKDFDDIKIGAKLGADFLAQSFVRSRADIVELRKVLEEIGGGWKPLILAKIEDSLGLNNISEIAEESDGAVVARGDLGVQLALEEIPVAQKEIIAKCNEKGKPCIVATQMLESMIEHNRPTRAESSDVANAVFEGADAVWLSGETAKGKYPLEAITVMSRIARRAEAYAKPPVHEDGKYGIHSAIAAAVAQMSDNLKADAIMVFTSDGFTPRFVSKFRPQAPVITATSSLDLARKLVVHRGVFPIVVEEKKLAEEVMHECVSKSLEKGFVQKGNLIVFSLRAHNGRIIEVGRV
jgi:pyruvate kinase